MTHGRFAAIALPVCICQETYGGIIGKIGRNAAHAIWIERQDALNTQKRVNCNKANNLEDDDRDRILRPGLFPILVNARNAIDAALDRTEDPPENMLFSFENTFEETTKRSRHRNNADEEGHDGDPAIK
ncbi:hypothetical protein WSS15_17310 [Acetobacter pasteurianus]|nr:hypothetical protein WSS15_17310 [Acetobacter pasteurianus]